MSEGPSLRVGNKRDLARALGVSLPTLDGLIARFPDFPVAERGTSGREYRFDIPSAVAFVTDKRAEAEREAEEKAEFLAQFSLPLGGTPEVPEGIKPSEMLAAAKLRTLQRKEAMESGLLVPTTEVRQVVTAAYAALNRRLNAVVNQIARTHALPDAVLRDMQARFHEAQRAFVAETETFGPGGRSPQLALAREGSSAVPD